LGFDLDHAVCYYWDNPLASCISGLLYTYNAFQSTLSRSSMINDLLESYEMQQKLQPLIRYMVRFLKAINCMMLQTMNSPCLRLELLRNQLQLDSVYRK
jgi:hypothetical protein